MTTSDNPGDTTSLVAGAGTPDTVKSRARCSDCGQEFTQVDGERSSANFKLAAHRYNVHGKRGDGRKTAPKDEPDAEELADRPVVSLVRSIGSAAGSSKRVPTEDDLAKGLGRGLGLITMGTAALLVESDPNIPDTPAGEAQRDALVDYLSLSDKAAKDLMHPFGRALAGTRLNARYGRGMIDNVDVVASIFELGVLASHYRKYFRLRAMGAGTRTLAAMDAAPMPAAPPAPGNVAAAVPMDFDTTNLPTGGRQEHATPPPTAGVILTPEMVQQQLRQRGAV